MFEYVKPKSKKDEKYKKSTESKINPSTTIPSFFAGGFSSADQMKVTPYFMHNTYRDNEKTTQLKY